MNKKAKGNVLQFTPSQLARPEGLADLCGKLTALVPDRYAGPWSEEELKELVQCWKMMAFCQDEDTVCAKPFHSGDGLFRTVVFERKVA
ncbi:hypothetical protein [uncultured Aquitalea sp.]|uniref:hypothetical protein n=1 Tax=uncultured Aquitalea sp. TaxID=540272 RepID=UPI0025F8411A|nr:hypothetical protein [uncultured Aquitalea sp.]